MIKQCDVLSAAAIGLLAASPIKRASLGLRGYDLSQFAKRASESLVQQVQDTLDQWPKGERLMHWIAVGSTEAFGPNRNGDGFRENTCKRCHPSFVRYAKFYRHHKNDDPEQSYGVIRASDYNPVMRRIELIIGLNESKEAADRNRGLIADVELHKVDRGEDLPGSMSCWIDHDICSWCGNKSKTSQEYCSSPLEGGNCKAGGLRSKMGRIVQVDGQYHHLHADNPEPLRFFDFSYVGTPAERTAYSLGVLSKSASAGNNREIPFMIADRVGSPALIAAGCSNANLQVADTIKKLAQIESEIEAAGCLKLQPVVNNNSLSDMDSCMPPSERAAKLAAMACAGRLLNPEQFIRFLGYDSQTAATVGQEIVANLPGVMHKLACDQELPELLKQNPFAVPAGCSNKYLAWAASQPGVHIDAESIKAATARGAIAGSRRWNKQAATDNNIGEQLATQYALYQATVLASSTNSDSVLTGRVVVEQNYAAMLEQA